MERNHTDSRRAFAGSRILTMDPSLARAEVVIIENDRIAAVGERGWVGGQLAYEATG